jgi:hypothetical protein
MRRSANIVNALNKRFDEIEKGTNETCALLMVASNQFGNGLGIKRANVILEILSEKINKRMTPLLNELIVIEGISDKLAVKIIIGFNKFYKWIETNQIKFPKCIKKVEKQTP